MTKQRKMTVEEYRKNLAQVEEFLVETIEITEKIQSAIETHSPVIEELYIQRKNLFDSASGFLSAWIRHVHLNAADSWNLYREFLSEAEDEHVKKQYQMLNNPSRTDSDSPLSIADNTFLIQGHDEVDDKEHIHELINKHGLTRSELHEIMSNLSLKEITELLNHSRDVSAGNIWEKKYDL
jgi:hypothetical protein